MLSISKRSLNLGTENAFIVLAEVNKLIKEGKNVISFCIGQPDFSTPLNIQKAAKIAIEDGKHGYTPSAGISELRSAVVNYFISSRKINFSENDIVIAAGAKPFIGYTIKSVTDYGLGDEVIYPVPGFPIYESQIQANGAIPVPIFLREENNFSINPRELLKKISSKTKLLILNSPQNPTGGIIPKKDMDEIVDILKNYPDIWIYSDEIYSRLIYDGEFVSVASYPEMKERTIISDGCSKTYAMTGWRLGFCANRLLAPFLTNWVTNTESCASHIIQWAGVEALNGPQHEAQSMRNIFLKRRNLIVKLLNEVPGVNCKSPGGAFYVWPNVTEACELIGCKDSEELRKLLLNEANIAVLADIHFGQKVKESGHYLRLSYAASEEEIKLGISRILNFIKKRANLN